MPPKTPRTSRAARWLAAAIVLALAGPLLIPAGVAAARPGSIARVREVRSIWTRKLGLARPSGIAYAASERELLVARSSGGGTTVLRATVAGDALGSFRLPLIDRGTLAFDAFRDRLTGIHDDSLITVAARDLADRRPAVTRTPIGDLGLVDPRAATFDPETGTWFVLDTGADAIVRVPPSLDASRVITLDDVDAARLSGLAFDPRSGLLYAAAADGRRLYAVDRSGSVRRTLGLGSLDLRATSAMTFAPSADRTDAPGALDVYVADSGNASWFGGVTEATLQQAAATSVPVVTATLVQTILTSNFTPASPDPAGVTYNPATDRLFVSDSEVDEVTGAGYHGVNIWQTTRTGSVLDTGTTVGYSSEPNGLGFDPATKTLFVSDDDKRRIFLLRPGNDGRWGTSDDIRSSIDVSLYGSTDTEDPAFDTRTGHLFFVDGVSTEVFEIDPVDGTFGNGDDVMTHFDVGQFAATDTEGLAYDRGRDILLVGDRPSRKVYEVTTTGTLLRIVDARGISGLTNISGLTAAPSSDGGRTDDWIVDRGVDNGPVPTENDGKMFEVSVPSAVDVPPSVTMTSPSEGATVAGTVTITADASDDNGLTKVEFFDGTTSIGTDTDGSNGWSVSWDTTAAADGAHTLTATATDTAAQTASDTNAVTVDNTAPTVALTSPIDGATVAGTTTVTADAADNNAVGSVRFFVDGTSIGTDASAQGGWSVDWDTVPSGNGGHDLTAVATDAAGNAATSAVIHVTVDNPVVSTIDAPIAIGSDDVEEQTNGNLQASSTDLDLMVDKTTLQRAVGLRFTGIAVPRGVTVASAYIQFKADETTSDPTTLTIAGDASDNSLAFRFKSKPSGRTLTQASVTWTPVPWTAGARTTDQRTPDLRSIVQEIVDRPGWAPGNALSLIITGTGKRVAKSYEAGAPPVLHVEFGTP